MSVIDYTNPITSGLTAAYVFTDSSATNLVTNSDTLTIFGDAFFDADGLNCPNTGSFTGAMISPAPAAFKTNDITVMWFGKILGDGNISDNPPLAGMFFNDPNSSPFISYGMYRRNPFQRDLYGIYAISGSFHLIDIAFAIDPTNYGTSIGYIFTRTSGDTEVFRDGTLIGSDSVAGNLDYDATAAFAINRHISVSGNSANTNVALVFIWNRALTGPEIASLSAIPRCFLSNSDFLGGSIVLEGSADSPTVSSFGDAQGDISLDGSIFNGVAQFLGDALGDIEIDGSVLDQVIALVGDAAGDIVIEGDMTGPIAEVPVGCISGDGVFTIPTLGSGNFSY